MNITGKILCKRCRCMVEDDDMSGSICIDCLTEIDRGQLTRDEIHAVAKACAECRGACNPSTVHPVPWCEDGCDETERTLNLMRNEQ